MSGPSLPERLAAAQRLADAAGTLLPNGQRDRLEEVALRARGRLAIAGDRTVVAVGGPTGVGKSSLVNALLATDAATVGRMRPTTADPLAVVIGDTPARELLRHVGVDRWEHLDTAGADDVRAPLDGLVLVDLPDHDSVVAAHRTRAEGLVAVADRLLWVVDPEKYADASVHDDVLVPLRHHGVVLTVVLNRVDRLAAGDVDEVVADLRRLLRERGLGVVDVMPVSARTGAGLDELRTLLAAVVADHEVAATRLTADLIAIGSSLEDHLPARPPTAKREHDRGDDDVVDAALVAAGVPAVVDAAAGAHRHRAIRATGWPPLRRLQARGRDPLARLGLGRDRDRGDVGARSSRGLPHGVATATLGRAVRARVDEVTDGWPTSWQADAHARLDTAVIDLPIALDRAIAASDLHDRRRPLWWSLIGLLQLMLALAMLVGAGWLLAVFVVDWFQLPPLPTERIRGIPWPTLALVGGAAAGLVLGWLSSLIARIGARRSATRLRRRLRASVATVVDERVHDVLGELTERARTARDALAVVSSTSVTEDTSRLRRLGRVIR